MALVAPKAMPLEDEVDSDDSDDEKEASMGGRSAAARAAVPVARRAVPAARRAVVQGRPGVAARSAAVPVARRAVVQGRPGVAERSTVGLASGLGDVSMAIKGAPKVITKKRGPVTNIELLKQQVPRVETLSASGASPPPPQPAFLPSMQQSAVNPILANASIGELATAIGQMPYATPNTEGLDEDVKVEIVKPNDTPLEIAVDPEKTPKPTLDQLKLRFLIALTDTIHDFFKGNRIKNLALVKNKILTGITALFAKVRGGADAGLDFLANADTMDAILKILSSGDEIKLSDIEESTIQWAEKKFFSELPPTDITITYNDILQGVKQPEEFFGDVLQIYPGPNGVKLDKLEAEDQLKIAVFIIKYMFDGIELQPHFTFDAAPGPVGIMFSQYIEGTEVDGYTIPMSAKHLAIPQECGDSSNTTGAPVGTGNDISAFPETSNGRFKTNTNVFTSERVTIEYVNQGFSVDNIYGFAIEITFNKVFTADGTPVVLKLPFSKAQVRNGPSAGYLAELLLAEAATTGTISPPNLALPLGKKIAAHTQSADILDEIINHLQSLLYQDIKRGGDEDNVRACKKISELIKGLIFCSGDRLCILYARIMKMMAIYHSQKKSKGMKLLRQKLNMPPEYNIYARERNYATRMLGLLDKYKQFDSGKLEKKLTAYIAYLTAIKDKIYFLPTSVTPETIVPNQVFFVTRLLRIHIERKITFLEKVKSSISVVAESQEASIIKTEKYPTIMAIMRIITGDNLWKKDQNTYVYSSDATGKKILLRYSNYAAKQVVNITAIFDLIRTDPYITNFEDLLKTYDLTLEEVESLADVKYTTYEYKKLMTAGRILNIASFKLPSATVAELVKSTTVTDNAVAAALRENEYAAEEHKQIVIEKRKATNKIYEDQLASLRLAYPEYSREKQLLSRKILTSTAITKKGDFAKKAFLSKIKKPILNGGDKAKAAIVDAFLSTNGAVLADNTSDDIYDQLQMIYSIVQQSYLKSTKRDVVRDLIDDTYEKLTAPAYQTAIEDFKENVYGGEELDIAFTAFDEPRDEEISSKAAAAAAKILAIGAAEKAGDPVTIKKLSRNLVMEDRLVFAANPVAAAAAAAGGARRTRNRRRRNIRKSRKAYIQTGGADCESNRELCNTLYIEGIILLFREICHTAAHQIRNMYAQMYQYEVVRYNTERIDNLIMQINEEEDIFKIENILTEIIVRYDTIKSIMNKKFLMSEFVVSINNFVVSIKGAFAMARNDTLEKLRLFFRELEFFAKEISSGLLDFCNAKSAVPGLTGRSLHTSLLENAIIGFYTDIENIFEINTIHKELSDVWELKTAELAGEYNITVIDPFIISIKRLFSYITRNSMIPGSPNSHTIEIKSIDGTIMDSDIESIYIPRDRATKKMLLPNIPYAELITFLFFSFIDECQGDQEESLFSLRERSLSGKRPKPWIKLQNKADLNFLNSKISQILNAVALGVPISREAFQLIRGGARTTRRKSRTVGTRTTRRRR